MLMYILNTYESLFDVFFFYRKFLTPSDKENIFTLDHYPVWYRRAAENPAGSFLYYVPTEDNTQGSPHPAVHIKTLHPIECIVLSIYFSFPAVDGRVVIAVTSVTVTVNKKTALAGGMIFPGYSYL